MTLFIKTVCRTLCLASLVLLGMIDFASCNVSKWRLVTTEPHPHSLEFLSLFFTDPNHGWAITPSQLLETSDGGKTWSERLAGDDKTFYSLEFVSQSIGFIVGTQRKAEGRAALILRTEDNGKSWSESAINIPISNINGQLQLHSISFCNSQIGWAVGADLILHTTDGGQTWETQRSGKNAEVLFGVACVTPERAWLVGQDGLILQTKDGGQSWSHQDSGTRDNLVRVRFFGNSGWIVGGSAGKGTLLRMRDGGASWERVPLDVSAALFDIYINGQQGWLIGTAGTILQTSDGGQTWQRERSPADNDLVSIFFLNPQKGWIGGDRHTVLRLSD